MTRTVSNQTAALGSPVVFGGGIEEFGWRGIVVHNMRRMNPFAISAIVGVIWFIWHLPLFFIVGVGQYQASVLAFSMGLLGYSFVTTALYLKTESVVPCIIFHALINAFAELGFWMAADTRLSYWDGGIRLVAGLAVFVAIVYARRRVPASRPSALECAAWDQRSSSRASVAE